MNSPLFPVLILAGGLATRLRPVTQTIPKALLEINGEPFVAHQLRLLQRQGVRKVVMCTGYLGEMILDCVGNGRQFGLEISYSQDGEKLLGTGGAIKKACAQAGENFFVLYGDSYLNCDYAAIQAAFLQSGRQALMTVYRNENRWDKANTEFSDGQIICYDKKNQTPRMQHIDYGLGVFSARGFDTVNAGEVVDLADIYQQLLSRQQLAAFEVHERFYEVGSFAGIAELEQYLGKEAEPATGAGRL